MILLFALLTFSTLLVSDLFARLVQPWAFHSQNLCTSFISEGRYKDIYEGLICGSRLPASHFKKHLIQTGLFHLLVASGAHLAFVEGVLRFTLRRRLEAVIPCVLLMYALLTGLCPPFLRALYQWGFRSFSNKFRLGWTPLQCLTLGGFATLVICNSEKELLSLSFSWIAGLAVHLARTDDEKGRIQNALFFQFSIYALLIPPTLALAVPHPLSILWNLLLGPLLTTLLFPAALISLVLPQSLNVIPDSIVSVSAWIVKQAAQLTPPSFEKTTFSPIWIWIYLFSLILAAHFVEQHHRRRDLP